MSFSWLVVLPARYRGKKKCESFIEVTVEVRVPFTRTIVVQTKHIEEGIQACLSEFPEISLGEGCQEYRQGNPELVI